jgi:hypothetical protein
MSKLKTEQIQKGSMVATKVTGFTDKELSELNSMDYREMKQKIAEALNLKQTIINAWVNGKSVFIETEASRVE